MQKVFLWPDIPISVIGKLAKFNTGRIDTFFLALIELNFQTSDCTCTQKVIFCIKDFFIKFDKSDISCKFGDIYGIN